MLKSHRQRGNEVGLFPLLRLAPFVSTNDVRATTKTSCDVSHGGLGSFGPPTSTGLAKDPSGPQVSFYTWLFGALIGLSAAFKPPSRQGKKSFHPQSFHPQSFHPTAKVSTVSRLIYAPSPPHHPHPGNSRLPSLWRSAPSWTERRENWVIISGCAAAMCRDAGSQLTADGPCLRGGAAGEGKELGWGGGGRRWWLGWFGSDRVKIWGRTGASA